MRYENYASSLRRYAHVTKHVHSFGIEHARGVQEQDIKRARYVETCRWWRRMGRMVGNRITEAEARLSPTAVSFFACFSQRHSCAIVRAVSQQIRRGLRADESTRARQPRQPGACAVGTAPAALPVAATAAAPAFTPAAACPGPRGCCRPHTVPAPASPAPADTAPTPAQTVTTPSDPTDHVHSRGGRRLTLGLCI